MTFLTPRHVEIMYCMTLIAFIVYRTLSLLRR